MVNEAAINISGGTWQPKWFMDIGNQHQVGIDIDDHYFVVLTKDIVGSWTPPKVAIRLGELAQSESVL